MTLRITIFAALLILAVQATRYPESTEEQWQEFEEFLRWKKAKAHHQNKLQLKYDKNPENYELDIEEKQQPILPPPNKAALVGRYIVNQADWTAVATISVRKDIVSFPVANLISYSDGPLGNGSGVPYLYLTPLDFTAQDLSKDHRATLLMSLAQGDYCKNKAWDPMDPRCARILLTGKIKSIRNDSLEHEVAKKAVFDRHPKLSRMPADHHFFFAKLKIASIAVLDTFGGPKYVSVKDYLHPPTTDIAAEFLRLFPANEKPREGEFPQGFNPFSNMLNPTVQNF